MFRNSEILNSFFDFTNFFFCFPFIGHLNYPFYPYPRSIGFLRALILSPVFFFSVKFVTAAVGKGVRALFLASTPAVLLSSSAEAAAKGVTSKTAQPLKLHRIALGISDDFLVGVAGAAGRPRTRRGGSPPC